MQVQGLSGLLYRPQQWDMRLEKSTRWNDRGWPGAATVDKPWLPCAPVHTEAGPRCWLHGRHISFQLWEDPDWKVVICKSFCVIWHSRYTSVRKVTEKSTTYKASQCCGGFSHAKAFLEAITLSGGCGQAQEPEVPFETDDESEILIKNPLKLEFQSRAHLVFEFWSPTRGNLAFHRLLRSPAVVAHGADSCVIGEARTKSNC